jgi:hypothetical protein
MKEEHAIHILIIEDNPENAIERFKLIANGRRRTENCAKAKYATLHSLKCLSIERHAISSAMSCRCSTNLATYQAQ